MPTDVVMPQMGESIAEGTIVRWIKKVGETVDRDEPLFEISTDKVDAEIPSPAAGVVSEIRAQEGETVAVNSVVAVIGGPPSPGAEAPGSGGAAKAADQADTSDTKPAKTPAAPAAKAQEPPKPEPQADGAAAPARSEPVEERVQAGPANRLRQGSGAQEAGPDEEKSVPPASRPSTTEEAIRQRSSPLVRKIAKEHNIDISELHGTGIAGRVTKNDILAFVEGQSASAPSASARPTSHELAGLPRRSPPQAGEVGQEGQVG